MGLNQVGNLQLFGAVQVEIVDDNPQFVEGSNNGAFASVTGGSGSFTLTMDPEFLIRPGQDVIEAEPVGATTAITAQVGGQGLQTQFSVFVSDGSDLGVDAPFAVTITRTLEG